MINNSYKPLSKDDILAIIERFEPLRHSSNGKQAKRKRRCIIYVRKSRIELGATHYSPKDQEQQCREYAKRQGWQAISVIVDLDETARHAKRDGFQELLGLIKDGQADIVLVPYIDRSYRNGFSFPKFLEFLDKHNARLVSVTEQFDTGTFHGRLIALVLGAMAEWPIWSASIRSRLAKHSRARDGVTNANYRFGYCNGLCSHCTDPNGPGYCPLVGGPDRAQYSGKRLIMVPHPIEHYAVILVVHHYHIYWSYRDIANYLNTHTFKLPDGRTVCFRTKGVPSHGDNRYMPGKFSRDSIRDIVNSLFYVGYVTYAESAPLNMRDDLEHPERIPSKKHHPRHPDKVYKGVHEPLYPFELWMENQQIRSSKAHTPITAGKPTRTYMLSDGVGFCWECSQYGLRRAGLRGSTNGSGQHSYRCATLHDQYKKGTPAFPDATPLDVAGILPTSETNFSNLIERHVHPTLSAVELERQTEALLCKLTLTSEMMELVLAYYLSDDGMSEFIIKRRNLFLEMERALTQHALGLLDDNDLESCRDRVLIELDKLRPDNQPEAGEIIALLHDFPTLLSQMTPLEKRTILRDVFAGIYFDGQGKLREARPHAPFAHALEIL